VVSGVVMRVSPTAKSGSGLIFSNSKKAETKNFVSAYQ
jgi:hypothetical protein